MSYVPTLADIPVAKKKPVNAERFTPTFSDIPKSPKEKDEFPWPQGSFAGGVVTPEETSETAKNARHAAVGAVQGAANLIPDTLNLINPSSHKVPRFDFAPDTTASKVGQFATPFAGPALAESAILGALPYIPKAMNALKTLTTAMKAKPVVNALAKAGKAGTSVGYVNALEHPESPKKSFAEGFVLGAPLSLLAPLAASNIPLAALGAKFAIGGTLGYLGGKSGVFGDHPVAGAVAGASLAAGIPLRPAAVEETLNGLNWSDVSKAVSANRRLKTTVTPAEASGNYVTAANEGRLKRTEAGQQSGYRFEETQKNEQQSAWKKTLDKI